MRDSVGSHEAGKKRCKLFTQGIPDVCQHVNTFLVPDPGLFLVALSKSK